VAGDPIVQSPDLPELVETALADGLSAGVRMPWPDVLDSAAALATALGITIED
jgi:hypothetical protein